MGCQEFVEQLSAYVDGELSPPRRDALETHVRGCAECAARLDQLRALAARLDAWRAGTDVGAPTSLWSSVEQRLAAKMPTVDLATSVRPETARRVGFRRPFALAAGFALLIGTAVFIGLLLSHAEEAHADPIDYSLLLDGASTDIDAAIQRFVEHYHSATIPADEAHTAAPSLRFAVPPELPHGFRREAVYKLQFGETPGIAAVYRRDGEPLVAFFHRPVGHEEMGGHEHTGRYRSLPCVIDGRQGHQLEAGGWRLVHLTDPTTCHCVLSTLDPKTELPAIMRVVAP